MKTLEAYLLDAEHNGVVDHQIHMTRGPNGEVRAIVFPIGGAPDGQPAVEWEVRGDTVCQPFMTFDAGEMLAVEGPALATKEDMDALAKGQADMLAVLRGHGVGR